MMPEDIGKLTDRQISDLYFRPKPDLEVPEAKSEDDIREWCAAIAQWQGLTDDKAKEWIERQVEKWRAEQRGKGGE